MDHDANYGKVQKAFRLKKETCDMLADLAVREGVTETAVVEDLIYRSHENLLQVPVDYVVDALFARLNPILNNLLSSERQSERYGNIAVEMLNSMIQNMTVQFPEVFVPSNRLGILKAELNRDRGEKEKLESMQSLTLKGAIKSVDEFYSYLKQRKDNTPPNMEI